MRHDCDNAALASRQMARLKDSGLRVRCRLVWKKTMPIKPAVNNKTRAWRQQVAGHMSDLADAKKYYKSPG
jgi:hypothetical protein